MKNKEFASAHPFQPQCCHSVITYILFTVFLYLKKSMTNENLQYNTLWR